MAVRLNRSDSLGSESELLLDACIPIAKFRGADPPFQQQHTDRFCNLILTEPLRVVLIEKVIEEVKNKYPSLTSSLECYIAELKKQSQIKIIPNAYFQPHITGILRLRNDAKKEGFDLSFTDSTQAFYAEKEHVSLISWDAPLIDYCELRKIPAFRPNEFCDTYESKRV